MSNEILDELFRNAAEKLEVEFNPSSWDKLKKQLEKKDVFFNFPKVKRTFGKSPNHFSKVFFTFEKFLKKLIKYCNK